MAAKKKPATVSGTAAVPKRASRGKTREGAFFPVPPTRAGLPGDYAETLGAIKQRIQQERLRVVLAANSAMVLLYWDIGRMILDRQEREGWGARVIERLGADLSKAFPDMRGFSPRNLKYMRAFAAAWPNPAIVQEVLAQITWYHNLTLIEKLKAEADRLWYAGQVMKQRFLLELGSGFAFVGRQVQLSFASRDYEDAIDDGLGHVRLTWRTDRRPAREGD